MKLRKKVKQHAVSHLQNVYVVEEMTMFEYYALKDRNELTTVLYRPNKNYLWENK